MLCIFSIVSIAVGQAEFMPGSIRKFVMNALMLENSYNGAWWYMFAYAVLVICSPVLLKAVKKYHPLAVLAEGFVVYCAAYYVRFNVKTDNGLWIKFGLMGMTLFEYLIGAVCYKIRFITWLREYWNKLPVAVRWIAATILIAGMLYGRTKIVPSLFVAPVTGSIIMALFVLWRKPKWIEHVILFVGNHSTNIWLTHMFFYSVLFGNFVYKAKYPVFIFAYMMVITLAVSLLLQIAQKPLHKAISRI